MLFVSVFPLSVLLILRVPCSYFDNVAAVVVEVAAGTDSEAVDIEVGFDKSAALIRLSN